jgi:alkanesulfonate monooxygenase
VVEILKQAWTQDEINYAGEVYDFKGLTTDPAKPYQTGGPLLYFGGYSPDALELCGQHCDVYLMWPEPKDQIAERMKAVNQVAEKYDRTLDYGLRVHVIVRDTEAGGAGVCRAPRLQARRRAGHADPRARARLGLARRQPPGRARELADQFGYVEPHLWTGIGRARSGCGAAIVGSADQVLSEIEDYRRWASAPSSSRAIRIWRNAAISAALVMPELKTCSLPG